MLNHSLNTFSINLVCLDVSIRWKTVPGDFLILCGADAHCQLMVNMMTPNCVLYTPASNMIQTRQTNDHPILNHHIDHK
jgi:hypothetical protein